jgi:serine/threonine protein kinase
MIRPGTAPVREGDLLAGKYRVERVLGAGGMGIVVAARHEELDQMVAIKFVRDEALDNDEAVQRFLREARAAVKLKSEHVARVLDVGKLESGAPYMVMEYLEGSDLGQVLTEQGPMDTEGAADWIMQACEAVAEAHSLGIVHRDLKPENLFLTNTIGGTQKIKVLDFGVSKAMGGASDLSNLTRTRAMLGSPLYMAPEQMRSSRDVDARADVWALGVVLFQLLTQRWPFEADTMPELCLKVVTEPPLSLASLRPDAPPGLVAAVERCVEKDPAKRFANAAELATALEDFAPPESRILAERARLAMAPRLPGESRASRLSREMGRVSTPGATLQSGVTPVTATPGTSAAWGKERVTGGSAPGQEGTRSRRPVVLGAVFAGAAGVAVLVFALHTAGGSPTTPAPAERPAVASMTTLPPAAPSLRPAEPPESPVPVAIDATPAPGASASSGTLRGPVPAGSSPGPRPLSGAAAINPPPALPGPPRVPGKPAANGPDDDIPTIR